MDDKDLRQNMIDTCKRLNASGYIFGTWGNASARLADGNILMTPSRVEYADMRIEDLPVLSPDGKQIYGEKLSTSERELHRGILNARPDVGAALHTHSPYAMAAGAIGNGIPALSEEMCQLLGGGIPVTGEFVPSERHMELGEAVVSALGKANALLIRSHGIICCGRTLREAEVACQIAEKSAMIYLALLSAGKPFHILDEPYVAMGREYYLNSYGKS